MIKSLKDSDDYLIKKVISIKVWEHNELAQDLANIKQTNFLDVHLGSLYLNDHGVQRADVIAVKPSYSRFCVTIYEIKVSRSDFFSDIRSEKWKGYLKHCHRFYFAVPAGMVKKDEVPPEAGLIYRVENGWNTQRAPGVRNIQIPQETLLSLLFCRERPQFYEHKRERLWQVYDYSKREETYKMLGREVGEALRNLDEYKRKKVSYENLSKRIREDIISVLGTEIADADLPEYDLRDLVRQILDKSKRLRLYRDEKGARAK